MNHTLDTLMLGMMVLAGIGGFGLLLIYLTKLVLEGLSDIQRAIDDID